MLKTEFFDIAAQQGFYGPEKGGLFGKKDNVRKYWEDIAIKMNLRPFIHEILDRKGKLRVADLGCGSGEGYNLLLSIPNEIHSEHREFVIDKNDIELYLGVDISENMIKTGKEIHSAEKNVKFMQGDLSKDHSFLQEGPFDIIFSTYSSPSHLTERELINLIKRIAETHSNKICIVLDLFAMYSAEWPGYWGNYSLELKEYNMTWLYLPERREPEENEIYKVKFWGGKEIHSKLGKIASEIRRNIDIYNRDRSILIGRHIDTGAYNGNALKLRYQVNRLLDRDYRGDYDTLHPEIGFLQAYASKAKEEYARIEGYANDWNTFINFTKALFRKDDKAVKQFIENTPEFIAEEMKMLAWLVRNSNRFPVVDFWASVYGPQLAAVLRNLEMNLPEGLGCGHGIMCNLIIE